MRVVAQGAEYRPYTLASVSDAEHRLYGETSERPADGQVPRRRDGVVKIASRFGCKVMNIPVDPRERHWNCESAGRQRWSSVATKRHLHTATHG